MQRGVIDLAVYQDTHRSRHLITGFIAAGVAVGLLLVIPQVQSLFRAQNAILVHVLVLIVAGALGVLAVRMGMAAAFAGLEKRQTVVAWRNLLSWALYIVLLVMLAAGAGINISTLLFAGGI